MDTADHGNAMTHDGASRTQPRLRWRHLAAYRALQVSSLTGVALCCYVAINAAFHFTDLLPDVSQELALAVFTTFFGACFWVGRMWQRASASDAHRENLDVVNELLAGDLARLAGLIAGGGKHAHLREAWAADLYGDPDADEIPHEWRRARLAAGFVRAAFRCRLDDVADMTWRPVDVVLSSWHGSNLAVLLPVTVALGLILARDGIYGLITNAENLGVIAGAPYGVIRAGRWYRQVDAPKRPEKSGPGSSPKR